MSTLDGTEKRWWKCHHCKKEGMMQGVCKECLDGLREYHFSQPELQQELKMDRGKGKRYFRES